MNKAGATTARRNATKYTPQTSIRPRAVRYIVTEFGSRGIIRYPMNSVPAKLPRVLIEVNRPTLPPTPATEEVITRTRNGPVIASSARGTK